MATISTTLDAAGDSLERTRKWATQGDRIYLWGCIICGTWVFGPIGSAMVIWGLILLRRADKAGVKIRPWPITLVGGFILADTIVNMYAWGFDLLAHDTLIGRSLWIDYGMMVDGGYMMNYNNGSFFGGVADHGEKSVEIAMVTMSMPIKLAATWGFLKMKRWGLQWMLISYWMYFFTWMVYAPNMIDDFELRFGMSEFGVPGFWLLVNIPFLGPLVLLPYLHTIKADNWES